MESADGEHIVGDCDRGSRKRQANLTSRERKKQVRYSNHDPDLQQFNIVCNHKNNPKLQCGQVGRDDILKLREVFYKNPNKVIQDGILASNIELDIPKRKRARKSDGKPHSLSAKYHVYISRQKVQICQKFVMAVYNVCQRRLNTICKKLQAGEEIIKEKRGDDRRAFKFVDKLDAVKSFISQLQGKESHYGRQKSRRIYISSEYNISILWQLYNKNSPEGLKVNYKYFSRVFSKYFNIGFGSPATDVCSYCVRTQTKISMSQSSSEKQKISTELKVHKFRATQFHKLMKTEVPNTVSYCFDLQQVQVLPKVPIQEAFYAQQLSIYFFCVTKLNCQEPIFYTWMEHQAGRGATETSSAIIDFLKRTEFPEDATKIRFFADGCGGQNKNSHVIHALMFWLHTSGEKIKEIEIIFPIRGHSYLPADRIFGRIEKILRSHSLIKTPDAYWELYTKVGEVRKLGSDWNLLDVKNMLQWLKKVNGISSCRRFFIKKNVSANNILVKSEVLYRTDTNKFQSLLKPRTRFDQVVVPWLPLGHQIKKKK
ncbi:uncharacterized protein LOC116182841 [Photinus pyralis]|uniref:uncharacterized protein LOC116182841 n=1 Tax=Photinus pyralis TaxID=7054 RepID=UPI0012670D68|nr:uncharacterized protein LOC116182841 [Photinus pyralis]